MANGIDSRYTGIGSVPYVVEQQDTSLTDFLEFIDRYQDKKDAKDFQRQQQSDLQEYRQATLDQEARAQDALNEYRRLQVDNEKERLKIQDANQKADAEYKKDTTFLKKLEFLPPKERIRQIMLSEVENPGFKARNGYTTDKLNAMMSEMTDYDEDVKRATRDISSNDPTKIEYHLRKLEAGDFDTNQAAKGIHLALSKQLGVAKKYQKDLYDVTPKEIANAYPAYAKELESIASNYIQGLNLEDMQGMSGDAMLALMNSQKGAIPPQSLPAYTEAVETLTKSYQNRYRNDRGIGVYEEGKVFPTRENMPSVVGEMGPRNLSEEDLSRLSTDLVRSQAEFEMSPEAISISDDDYTLIEKLQEEGNPIFEKWLNDEEYTLSDLQTDYDANIKAKQEAEKEDEVIQEDVAKTEPPQGDEAATEPPQGDEAATVNVPVRSSLPGDAMAAALEGIDYNEARDALTDAELIAQNQIVQEETKDDLATYEPGLGWLNSEGERANKEEIETAQKAKSKQPKQLSNNQRKNVSRLEGRINYINNLESMAPEVKAEKIQRLVNQIRRYIPDYQAKI